MAKKRQVEKKSWIVRMKCVVIKEVVTDECTREEASNSPFEHAIDENEIEQTDWEVQSVEEND